MLSQKTMDALAEMTGITADVLAKAISDEQEKDLELPKGRFLTKENEETLLDNHGKRKYDEGKSKALKDAYDGKDKEDFLKDIKKSILDEAKIEPNKKLAEKEQALEELRTKYKTDIDGLQSKYATLENQLTGIRTQSEISKYLPSELPQGLTRDDATMIVGNNFEFKEGQVYKNGKLLLDDMQNPITMDKAIASFVEERKWQVQKPHGRGPQTPNYKGGVPKSYEEFEEYCKSKEITVGSKEANDLMAGFAKDSPEFFN